MSANFEQWLQFVFSNPVKEREWYWDEDFGSRWEALELTDALIVQYMTRLFLEPEVLRPYSPDQVAQALWFLIGESSPGCSSEALLRHEAALPDRVACIRAMSSFFRNYVLGGVSRQFEPKASTNEFDDVAHMWWDIFPMNFYMRSHASGPAVTDALVATVEKWKLPPELHSEFVKGMIDNLIRIEPEIHQATLSVMTEVLELPSETCQFSALHGLGHWHGEHPEQVERIVDAFLARHKDLSAHVIEYASRARVGNVL